MFKKIALYIALLLLPALGMAQELNCSVDLVSPQIQDAAAQLLFTNLKGAITQFMNNTKFTNDNIGNQEKIECTLYFNMTAENAPGDFNATLQIQARRPIYKSSYNSAMFNYQDNNIHIVYNMNQPIIFNLNAYSDNLTAILSYYAYLIIGDDYDSFSLNGGTRYLLDAQTVVTNAQNSGEKGWSPLDGDQTRYSLITNLLDETYFAPLRRAMYQYHRLGLDIMYASPEKGRAQITEALNLVQEVYNDKPSNFNVALFFNAKATEIANIFSEATNDEKTAVYTLVSNMDPTDIDKYVKLKVAQ